MQDKHQSCEKLDHETTLCFSEPGVNKAILYPQTRSLLAQLQREHQLSFLSSFFMSWQAFILPMLTAPWCVISVSRDSGIQFFRGLRMVHDVQCVQRELLPAATSSLWEPSDLQVPIATTKLPSAPGHQKETNGLKLLRLSLVIALLY